MEYFFRKKFKRELPYFKKQDITYHTRADVLVEVLGWFTNNLPQFNQDIECVLGFEYIMRTTLEKIDLHYDEGEFYYMWLNDFLRETSYFVWRTIDKEGKLNKISEKERSKLADAKMKAFEQFCKETFK